MAYSVKVNHPSCPAHMPVAVVNGAGIKMSCHADEASARAAMRQMMANGQQGMSGGMSGK